MSEQGQQTCMDLKYLGTIDKSLLQRGYTIFSAKQRMELARYRSASESASEEAGLLEVAERLRLATLEDILKNGRQDAFDLGIEIGKSFHELAAAQDFRTLRTRFQQINDSIFPYLIDETNLHYIRELAEVVRKLESGGNVF